MLSALLNKKLINKTPKGDSIEYFHEANEILKKESETESKKITSLKKEIQILTTRLANLKSVLSDTERNLERKQVNLIKEQIFSLAKKVK